MVDPLVMDQNNPKKKGKLTGASDVLQSLFENGKSPLSDQFLRWKLWARWGEIVGPTVAKNAEPVGLQRGMLIVWVRHSAWMQQMIFMKDHIKNAINTKFEHDMVKHIKFTTDRREVPGDHEAQEELRRHLGVLEEDRED